MIQKSRLHDGPLRPEGHDVVQATPLPVLVGELGPDVVEVPAQHLQVDPADLGAMKSKQHSRPTEGCS